MISEDIKSLLGAELSEQVATALLGKGEDGSDVDLVCGNNGTSVPTEKYAGLKQRTESAERTLKAAAEALKAIGGLGTPETIASDIATAQQTMEVLKNDHKRELAKIQTSTALKMALTGQVHDPADVMRLLDLEQLEVDGDGTLKTDLTPLLGPIREKKPYLFRAEKPQTQPLKGAQPAPIGSAEKTAGPMTYSQICAFLDQNPDAQIDSKRSQI